MGAVQKDITVIQGKTFSASFGWAKGSFIWKQISAISNTAPLTITAVGHDLKDGWPFWVSGVKKPDCLNNWRNTCPGEEPADPGAPYIAEATSDDVLTLNSINGMALDAYTGDGVIKYYARADITGYEADMQVRSSTSSDTILFEATSTGATPAIIVNEISSTFELTIPADAFADAKFQNAVYEIEISAPGGEKYRLAFGQFALCRELVK